jgi:uncharacterized protein
MAGMGDGPRQQSAELLRFLGSPAAYADEPTHIAVIETHFAWVFLSHKLAYKLHKPIRFHQVDFTTLAKRKRNCERAVRLNRRLAESVYIGAVPLVRTGAGLVLEGDGEPVEWLVKMHRLREESMLDYRLTAGTIERCELVPAIEKLAGFYARSPAVHWDGERYAGVLRTATLQWAEELSAFPNEINIEEADRLVTSQLGFIGSHQAALDERVARGRVVDAHGDLRPEHIALSDDPQIIDCLEFSDELRLLDSADEISGLALECACMGREDVARHIVAAYRIEADDPFGDDLLAFYQSRHALRRALLCAWHLEDPMYSESEQQWIARAHKYLRIGHACLDGRYADCA